MKEFEKYRVINILLRRNSSAKSVFVPGSHTAPLMHVRQKEDRQMKRFKNIPVIYDVAIGGDVALGQAVAYARENTTGLTIAADLCERQPETLVAVEIQQRLQRLSSGVQHGDRADVGIEILAAVDPMRAADDHLKWQDHGPGDIAGITEKFDSSHDAERRVA